MSQIGLAAGFTSIPVVRLLEVGDFSQETSFEETEHDSGKDISTPTNQGDYAQH